jgi:hypothetical protein
VIVTDAIVVTPVSVESWGDHAGSGEHGARALKRRAASRRRRCHRPDPFD